MTKRQEEYQEYRSTVHWANLREEVFKRDGYHCVRCGDSRRILAHHKTYRDKFEDSEAFELETLCWWCHQKEHGFDVKKPNYKPKQKLTKRQRRKLRMRRPRRQRREKPAGSIVGIVDYTTLLQARTARRINRRQFKELSLIYPYKSEKTAFATSLPSIVCKQSYQNAK